MTEDKTPLTDQAREGSDWFPEELKRYDANAFNHVTSSYAFNSMRRFAALACILSGGEENASVLWANKPELKKFEPMLAKVKRGGHIVDIGAGLGESSAGMVLYLSDKFGLPNLRYLLTDYGGYYESTPDIVDMLGETLTHSAGPIFIDHPDDYYHRWSNAVLTRDNWRDLRSRVIRRYGDRWDATVPAFFEHARKELDGEEIGLMMLRHPEIGDKDQPELVPVFTSIIHNMLVEAMRTNTPVLITSSNNLLSQENIQKAISSFFAEQGKDAKEIWQVIEENPLIHKLAMGPRQLDVKFWMIFPSQI